ncbi:MAG: hypothetical protein Ct9H300mP21_04350 [Pseudomonadota bacterium]|nr:MAG: hypothetical protein Ct9H300mP21_04350 [Pseudomonadota bacterium]
MQAKVLSEAAKNIDNLKILAGILVGDSKTSILNTGEVEALSNSLLREELIVKLLFPLCRLQNSICSTQKAVPGNLFDFGCNPG